MCRKKLLSAGCLVLFWLSALSLPIFSEQETVVLTLDEYNAVMNSLTWAEKELKAAKLLIEQQDKILTMQSNLWPMLKEFSNEQESALKSEYRRGYLAGALTWGAAGFAAGGASGFKLGITIQLPAH